MPYVPASFDAMVEAIRSWVAARLTGVTVIYAEQDAPAPPYPFATVNVISPPKQMGAPVKTLVDNGSTVTNRLEYDAEFTVSIQIFAHTEDSDDPIGMMGTLQASLLASSTLEALDAAGVAVIGTEPPIKLPAIGGAQWVRRASMDAHFRARARLDDTSTTWLDQTGIQIEGATASPGSPHITGTVGTA